MTGLTCVLICCGILRDFILHLVLNKQKSAANQKRKGQIHLAGGTVDLFRNLSRKITGKNCIIRQLKVRYLAVL